jgi:hypothetical protein
MEADLQYLNHLSSQNRIFFLLHLLHQMEKTYLVWLHPHHHLC